MHRALTRTAATAAAALLLAPAAGELPLTLSYHAAARALDVEALQRLFTAHRETPAEVRRENGCGGHRRRAAGACFNCGESDHSALGCPLRGIDVNEPRTNKWSPLRAAASFNAVGDTVNWLIAHGGDAAQRDALGCTPLHYAAAGDHSGGAVVDLLVRAGADPLATSLTGLTPLHVAAKAGHAPAALAIIAAGGYNRQENMGGATPLALAVKSERLAIILLLQRTTAARAA